MRTVTIDERRARLVEHQSLGRSDPDLETAVDGIVALHSTDPVTVFLSCWARIDGFERSQLEEALYERRSLVRMHGMRRTLFVVPAEVAGTVGAACSADIAAKERRRLAGFIEGGGHADDGESWLEELTPRVLEALARRGEAAAADLIEDVPELALKLLLSPGKPYEVEASVASRLVLLLGMEGRIVRGRPVGTWLSSQYRWLPAPDPPSIDPDEARAELVRRWLRSFGPGTLTDVKWWGGWTVSRTKAALAEVGAVEVELEEGGPGYLLPDDLDPPPKPRTSVALLPALDATVMGYKERDWFLGPHAGTLFDRNGNAGPTVWLDGRVVGGWGLGPGGDVEVRLLDDVPKRARARITEEAGRLTAWLDGETFTPRFRTPLEQDIATG